MIYSECLQRRFINIPGSREFYSEKDDCTVRAMAAAYGITYAESHELCKKFGREDRQGFHIQAKLTENLWRAGKLKVIPATDFKVKDISYQKDKTYLIIVQGHIFCIDRGCQANDDLDNSAKKIIRLFEVIK